MTEFTTQKICIVLALLLSVVVVPVAYAVANVTLDVTVPIVPSSAPLSPIVVPVYPPPQAVSEYPPGYLVPEVSAPPAPTYAAPPPPPVVYQAPVFLPDAPPQFVFVPELGYYVAAGVAFDMIFDGRSYYYHRGGYWYRTGYYGGAWSPVAPRMMPAAILRFQIGDIHRHSAKEFVRYNAEGARYYGKVHRPEQIRRSEQGHRSEDRRERREERR